jgi:hypothetical protein
MNFVSHHPVFLPIPLIPVHYHTHRTISLYTGWHMQTSRNGNIFSELQVSIKSLKIDKHMLYRWERIQSRVWSLFIFQILKLILPPPPLYKWYYYSARSESSSYMYRGLGTIAVTSWGTRSRFVIKKFALELSRELLPLSTSKKLRKETELIDIRLDLLKVTISVGGPRTLTKNQKVYFMNQSYLFTVWPKPKAVAIPLRTCGIL